MKFLVPPYYLSPEEYESLLMVLNGYSREKAKKLVDELYIEQYGISREEDRKQSEEFWKGYKWNKKD